MEMENKVFSVRGDGLHSSTYCISLVPVLCLDTSSDQTFLPAIKQILYCIHSMKCVNGKSFVRPQDLTHLCLTSSETLYISGLQPCWHLFLQEIFNKIEYLILIWLTCWPCWSCREVSVHLINFAVYHRGHHCEWAPGDAFTYCFSTEKQILDPKMIWGMKNVQQISSYKSLSERNLMSQMCAVTCALEMWLLPCPGYHDHLCEHHPFTWQPGSGESTVSTAGCRAAMVGHSKDFGLSRKDQHCQESQWLTNAWTALKEKYTSEILL